MYSQSNFRIGVSIFGFDNLLQNVSRYYGVALEVLSQDDLPVLHNPFDAKGIWSQLNLTDKRPGRKGWREDEGGREGGVKFI